MPWWSSDWARQIQDEIGRESKSESELHDALAREIDPALVQKLRAYCEGRIESEDLTEEIEEIRNARVKRILGRFMSRRK